jgi:hypothetical protein
VVTLAISAAGDGAIDAQIGFCPGCARIGDEIA